MILTFPAHFIKGEVPITLVSYYRGKQEFCLYFVFVKYKRDIILLTDATKHFTSEVTMAGIFPPDFKLNVSDRSLAAMLEEYHFPRDKRPANSFEKLVRNQIKQNIQKFMTDVVSVLQRNKTFNVEKIKWYYMVWREGTELTTAASKGFPTIPVAENEVTEFIDYCIKASNNDLLVRVESERTLFSHMCALVASYMLLLSQIERYAGVYHGVEPAKWFEKLNSYQQSREQTPIELAWISVKDRIGTVMGLKL